MAESIVALLPSRDLDESLAFWGRLGFDRVGEPLEGYSSTVTFGDEGPASSSS